MLSAACLCPPRTVSVAAMLVQAELAKSKAEAGGVRVRVCVLLCAGLRLFTVPLQRVQLEVCA